MGSHQDFRSLQAKFQASQLETSELPKKPSKPEFNKLLKKLPTAELSEHPKKPPQPEVNAGPRKSPQPSFPDLPRKPPKPEFGEFSKKFPQLGAPQEASQPEPGRPARPPPEPKSSSFPKKLQQAEPNEAIPDPSQPDFRTLLKPLQPQVGDRLKVCLLKPEFSEVPQTPPWKTESSELHPHPSKPDFSTLPKKLPQPEFSGHPRKPPQPQVGDHPKVCLPQPEFSEAPQTPPWKAESSEPHPQPSQLDFSTLPKKTPAPQLSDLPKKLLRPDFGDLDLIRRSSEPDVSVVPKRPRQSESKGPSKKPLQPELGGLPRVSSEPEFGLLPSKLPQPECQRLPRKLSQPEPSALPKQHRHAEFFGDLPRKPPLPGSVSESSLPTAVARLPLSLAYAGRPRLGLKPAHPPRRRPLPPVSSLGPPPAKPPLPPGPRDVQSFQRAAAAATALRRARSAAAIHFQAPQTFKDIPHVSAGTRRRSTSCMTTLSPQTTPAPAARAQLGDLGAVRRRRRTGGQDGVPSTQQAPRPAQDPELRKEKAPQPQQLPPADPKSLKQIRKAEKAEREFRKKFKFEGEIVIQTRMMIDPNAKTRRGGGKYLGIRRGEILEVIEFTNKEEMLCRDTKGKYGYVPRTALLPLETEVYDDVGF
ncbi:PML-RARA-regulated adapter molecule 1 isoform X1 [Suricata suricatta]|uniref:PML-RARA-regulated adapter molecule 1 isoform X1 n=1 Tax=Suricata suricatta TaxID=37032 RepID=UPI001155ADF3|nr:PML-RARA-regulated adapter molecule 1 isoform X1 [Suricata suricatta]